MAELTALDESDLGRMLKALLVVAVWAAGPAAVATIGTPHEEAQRGERD
jgi:hypothetical protein